MSLSSSIHEEENPFVKIETFEGEDICEESEKVQPATSQECVELPVCSTLSKQTRGSDSVPNRGQTPNEETEDPETRLARLEREAYEKGFAQGQKDGLALEERQIQEKGKQLDALFAEFNGLRVQIHTEAEKDLLKLSFLIAKRIIGQEIATNPQIIGQSIRSAMKFLVDKHHIRILINPEDMEEVRKILPEIARLARGGKFQVVEDRAVDRGGCLLETGFGRVNATLDDQLEMLEKEIDEEFQCSRGGSA